jgi:hypothetical protein
MKAAKQKRIRVFKVAATANASDVMEILMLVVRGGPQ